MLVKYGLEPLTDQQLAIVATLCEDEGGINADTLPPIDKHIITNDDGTFAICRESARPVSAKRPGIQSPTIEKFTAALMNSEKQQLDQPNNENVRSCNTSPSTTAKRRKTEHATQISYAPAKILQWRYGALDIDDEPGSTIEETQEFGNHEIPVGTYKLDPQPKRLVTGTIDLDSQSIVYTVHDIDKHFVQVNTDKSYTAFTGTTWASTGDIGRDSENITFLRVLHGETFQHLQRYIFDEMRSNGEFQNHWRSVEDMAQHPELMRMMGVFRVLVEEEMDGGGGGGGHGESAARLDLQQIVEGASKLAQALNDAQDDWGGGGVAGQAKCEIWRRFGELFEVFMTARRNTGKT